MTRQRVRRCIPDEQSRSANLLGAYYARPIAPDWCGGAAVLAERARHARSRRSASSSAAARREMRSRWQGSLHASYRTWRAALRAPSRRDMHAPPPTARRRSAGRTGSALSTQADHGQINCRRRLGARCAQDGSAAGRLLSDVESRSVSSPQVHMARPAAYSMAPRRGTGG